MTPQEIIDAYKAEMEQHRKKAYAEGREQGLAEARAEQRAEGIAESIVKVYTWRFGVPPADVSERIIRVRDLPTLYALLDLAVIGSADDLPRAVCDLPTP